MAYADGSRPYPRKGDLGYVPRRGSRARLLHDREQLFRSIYTYHYCDMLPTVRSTIRRQIICYLFELGGLGGVW